MICNAGLVTGFQRDSLRDIVDPFTSKYDLIMPPNKSYCFIKFSSTEDATLVCNEIHNRVTIEGHDTPLYATFTESGTVQK